MIGLTLRSSGSPKELNKEARLWRVRCKRLFGALDEMSYLEYLPMPLNEEACLSSGSFRI
jgi:hypothetical protein